VKKLELGLFLPVGTRGFIISTCPTPIAPTYEYNKEITLLAERMELDFVLQPSQSAPRGSESTPQPGVPSRNPGKNGHNA
jgi:pyrimidine oxygenase